MNRANQESKDSPFMKNGAVRPQTNTRVLKQKLCGGISAGSPSYFHLQYIDVLDQKSRTQELLKGYKAAEKNDYKLTLHPGLVPQDRKSFNYEDFRATKGKSVFDYSTMKPSNLIDLVADKRPTFKTSSMFYKKYNEKLSTEGFGRIRGIFTIESNQKHKFGSTASNFNVLSNQSQSRITKNFTARLQSSQKDLIQEQALQRLPIQYRSGKSMQRFLKKGYYNSARNSVEPR